MTMSPSSVAMQPALHPRNSTAAYACADTRCIARPASAYTYRFTRAGALGPGAGRHPSCIIRPVPVPVGLSGRPRGYQASQPPSTANMWPVTSPDAREARKSMAPSRSSGTPTLRMGVRAMILALIPGSEMTSWVREVSR